MSLRDTLFSRRESVGPGNQAHLQVNVAQQKSMS